MKEAIRRFWNEQVIFWGLTSGVLALAAGVWESKWLAFLAAAFAFGGSLFARSQSTPVSDPRDSEGRPLVPGPRE
jgi:hypothetical protein